MGTGASYSDKEPAEKLADLRSTTPPDLWAQKKA